MAYLHKCMECGRVFRVEMTKFMALHDMIWSGEFPRCPNFPHVDTRPQYDLELIPMVPYEGSVRQAMDRILEEATSFYASLVVPLGPTTSGSYALSDKSRQRHYRDLINWEIKKTFS